MPNWCSTAYAIEGDAKEVKKLYKLMTNYKSRKNRPLKTASGKLGWDALWTLWVATAIRFIVEENGATLKWWAKSLNSQRKRLGVRAMRHWNWYVMRSQP